MTGGSLFSLANEAQRERGKKKGEEVLVGHTTLQNAWRSSAARLRVPTMTEGTDITDLGSPVIDFNRRRTSEKKLRSLWTSPKKRC